VSDVDAAAAGIARPSVFLSYASEDRAAARVLRDALPAYGLDVWYDENELGGGEAWDQKIRRQIRECDFFMPVVSARTEARREGYFRREWRLAVERTLDMADDHTFLLPVVIDDTNQATARVPEKFLQVQWLKVPGGEPTRALESMCRRIAGPAGGSARPAGGPAPGLAAAAPAPAPLDAAIPARLPADFPRQEPGRQLQYFFEVMLWSCRAAWQGFQRLPRWLRIIAYIWLAIALLSRCDSSGRSGSSGSSDSSDSAAPAVAAKHKAIALNSADPPSKTDLVTLGKQIAKEIATDSDDADAAHSPILAVPFSAPAANQAAHSLADSAFAMAYGKANLAHQGQVTVTGEPLSPNDLESALERGRTEHAQYVLWGTVEPAKDSGAPAAGHDMLVVKIVKVKDGTVLWTRAYDVASTDPARIAADINAHLPSPPAE
jgi:hypothetical protein